MQIPPNMSAMLERLGLEAAMLAPSDLRLAVDSCHSCDADQVCLNWLVRAPEWLDRAPVFCRNTERFVRISELDIALTPPALAIGPPIHKIWPLALIAFGFGLTAAWVCFLGYELFKLIQFAI